MSPAPRSTYFLMFFVSFLLAPDAFAQTGACCQPSGNCLDVANQSACNFFGGVWHGLGTECCTPSIPCSNNCGACCSTDGSCTYDNNLQCMAAGHVFMGNGTDCSPNPCAQPGACCMPNGSCQMASQLGGADCTSAGGVYQGDNTNCSGVSCPQPGACCMPDASCFQSAQIGGADCASAGGTYLGNNVNCSQGLCLGACCDPTGTCASVSESACEQSGGDFLGIGSACAQVQCSGACCMLDGSCLVTVRGDCEAANGVYQGHGTDCGVYGCAVLWDNGQPATGPATGSCIGEQSLLQNQTRCLNFFGYSAATEGSAMLADDFTLSDRSYVSAVTLYAYETGTADLSITAATVRIHSAQPSMPGQSVIASSTVFRTPVTFTNVYRQSQSDSLCTRRLQRMVVDMQGLVLNAGTYWISFDFTGGPLTGPFVPPVSIIGAYGKPNANAVQSTSGAAFQPVVDAGAVGCTPAPPTPNPQDFPFTVEGRLDSVLSCCLANGTCVSVFESNCVAQGGYIVGPSIDCTPGLCGVGACCLNNQSCTNMTPVACAAAGGVPGALGVACETLSDLDGDGFLDECDNDDDGDGVPDASDACPESDPAAAVDADSGRPLGDMNSDCIVDGSDIAGFVEQLLGK